MSPGDGHADLGEVVRAPEKSGGVGDDPEYVVLLDQVLRGRLTEAGFDWVSTTTS